MWRRRLRLERTKTLNGSNIITMSLGSAREFVLTSEQAAKHQRIALEDGDLPMLLLGHNRTTEACLIGANLGRARMKA
jgi:alkylated DNA repair dioxygenase AlkB